MSDPSTILDPAAAVVQPAPAETAAPVEAPAVAVEPAAAVVETPAAATNLLAPETPAPAAAETPAETPPADPSAAPAAEKPADPAAAAAPAADPAAAPAAEPGAEVQPETAPLPTYEPFTTPENFTIDNEGMAKFTGAIGELGLDQAGGQKLWDLYTAETTRLLESVTEAASQHQWQVFEDTKRQWVKEFEEDPEIGRNRQETSIREARDVVKLGFGVGGPGWNSLPPEEQAARQARLDNFYTKLSPTGFQNNPESVRLLVGLYKHLAPFFKERERPPESLAPQGREGLRPADRRYGPNGGTTP